MVLTETTRASICYVYLVGRYGISFVVSEFGSGSNADAAVLRAMIMKTRQDIKMVITETTRASILFRLPCRDIRYSFCSFGVWAEFDAKIFFN
jgi:hypothetical protein